MLREAPKIPVLRTAMPRPSKDWQPAPSQRHCSDIRRAEAKAAEAARVVQVKEEEKQHAFRQRSTEKAEIKRLEEELKDLKAASLAGLNGAIGKLSKQSSTFYDHVAFGYDWLKRYNILDIPPLIAAVLKKLGNEKGEDLRWKTLMDEGMASARNALLHEHEEQISKHLTEKVFTGEHFALLRLVGGMSKRLCGLIEQSLKYVHRSDGTRSKQRLHPASTCTTSVPAIFSLRAIIFAEREAEIASNLELRQHEDKRGADICSKAYALDQAMLQSIGNTSRAGGMATEGTKTDPHLVCISGDGAGLTAANTGVRVGHFVGSTNLLNQSSLDVVTWLFYKAQTKAEDYTILNARLIAVLPDLQRLFNGGEPGELLLDGVRRGSLWNLCLWLTNLSYDTCVAYYPTTRTPSAPPSATAATSPTAPHSTTSASASARTTGARASRICATARMCPSGRHWGRRSPSSGSSAAHAALPALAQTMVASRRSTISTPSSPPWMSAT